MSGACRTVKPSPLPDIDDIIRSERAFVTRVLSRAGVAERDLPDVEQEVFLVVHRRLPEFERRYQVRVDVQEVDINAIRRRLQAAFLAGTEVPDLVEVPDNLANFISGPL